MLTVWALRRVGASLHFDTRRDMNHYLLAISGGMLASGLGGHAQSVAVRGHAAGAIAQDF